MYVVSNVVFHRSSYDIIKTPLSENVWEIYSKPLFYCYSCRILTLRYVARLNIHIHSL